MAIGSTAILSSGTSAGSIIGSALIAANSLYNPCHLHGRCRLAINGNNSFGILLSGTEFNTSAPFAGSGYNGGTSAVAIFDALLGSPFNGFTSILFTTAGAVNSDTAVTGNMRFGTVAHDDINVGSKFVVFFILNNNAQGNAQAHYAIQSEGTY